MYLSGFFKKKLTVSLNVVKYSYCLLRVEYNLCNPFWLIGESFYPVSSRLHF